MNLTTRTTAFLATVAMCLGVTSSAPAQDGDAAAIPPEQEVESAEESSPDELSSDEAEEAEVVEDVDGADEDSYEPAEDDEGYGDYGETQTSEQGVGECSEKGGPCAGRNGGASIDLGVYFRSDGQGSNFNLSPILSGWYAVTEDLEITLDWGLGFDSYTPDGGKSASSFVLGNPFLGIRRVLQEGRTRIHFGIGATVPISSVPAATEIDYRDQVAAYLTASAMRGNWNHWLWMPEHFSIAMPAGASMVTEEHVMVGGETAIYVLIPVDDYNDKRADFYIQVAGDIGFGWDKVVTGLRLQGVVNATEMGDRLQSALGPFVRADICGGHFTGRFVINLDQPAGVFGGGDLWGLHLGGGADF